MLLDRVEKVFLEPFPHVVIENALDDKYYEELSKTRPSPGDILQGRPYSENERIDRDTISSIQGLSPIWSEFCSYHSSYEFLKRVFKVFGDEIHRLYPGVQNLGMRCQPGINTPTDTFKRVRGPHLDNPTELYAGLFYMAQDFDGGSLQLYKKKRPLEFHGKLEIKDKCVELYKTVRYMPNVFVMFLNTPESIHGVTPRKSRNFRYLVNLVGDADFPLFKIGHNGY